MINIDKHKDINGYVIKLTDIINNKIKLTNVMSMRIGRVMCNIKNKTNMVNEKIHKVSDIDNDTLHLIDDTLDEIITYLIKRIKKIKKKIKSGSGLPDSLSQDWGSTYSKNIRAAIQISDNTTKIIVSQDFGGKLTAKIA